jgi:hypothetical protein
LVWVGARQVPELALMLFFKKEILWHAICLIRCVCVGVKERTFLTSPYVSRKKAHHSDGLFFS